MSFSFKKIFAKLRYRSSSSVNDSLIVNVRFLLTKLEVPALPDMEQSIPFQLRLKLL
jgi:hypothetical protein